MDPKYDRVAYPENVYLHSDGEVEDFGTGVYPVSVISRKRFRDDYSKIGCIRVKRKLKPLILVFLGLFTFCSIVIVILIASRHSQKMQEKQIDICFNYRTKTNPNEKNYGLFFEPVVDGSSTICLSRTINFYEKYSSRIASKAERFSLIEPNKNYVQCQDNETAKEDETCRYEIADFGLDCTKGKEYGYSQERPCILLTLKLEKGVVPVPFRANDSVIKDQVDKEVVSPYHIAVTCNPKTSKDKENMGNDASVFNESPINVFPKRGFALKHFPNTGSSSYIAPAVMVNFNTIYYTFEPVNFLCVAWVKDPEVSDPRLSKKYTSEFQIIVLSK